MQPQRAAATDAAIPFRSAEQAWIWAARLLLARSDGRAPHPREGGQRPCTPDDLVVLLHRLHRAGRLTLEQAAVLRRYGDMGRAPQAVLLGEGADWHRWRAAIRAMEPSLIARGIVRPASTTTNRRRA
jgi:hypothetical protein